MGWKARAKIDSIRWAPLFLISLTQTKRDSEMPPKHTVTVILVYRALIADQYLRGPHHLQGPVDQAMEERGKGSLYVVVDAPCMLEPLLS